MYGRPWIDDSRLAPGRTQTVVPRISIVTPSCNQSKYVGETIESVLSQEGDFEIEYSVMDGGSTDGSVDIIRRYADLVASGGWPVRCRGITMSWVSERDAGQTAAINAGLRHATGDIFSYINSDDLYFRGAFQRVVEAFAGDPEADFVYGDGDVIDGAGARQWEWLSRPYNHAVMTSYHWLWNDFTNYILQQATFWRRRVRERIGDFDPTFHFAWMPSTGSGRAAGLRLRHLPEKLGKFRDRGLEVVVEPHRVLEDYWNLPSPPGQWSARRLLYLLLLQSRPPVRWRPASGHPGGRESVRAVAGSPGGRACRPGARRTPWSTSCAGLTRARPTARRRGGGRGCHAAPSACGAAGAGLAPCRCRSAVPAVARSPRRRGARSLRHASHPSVSEGALRLSVRAWPLRRHRPPPAFRGLGHHSDLPSPAMLLDCVASILRNDFLDFEIIIVDQDRERTLQAELVRRFNGDARIVYLTLDAPSASRARNLAIRRARGHILVFCDDDVEVEPDWLRAYMAAFDACGQEPIVVGGRLDPLWVAPRPHWLPESKEGLLGVYNKHEGFLLMPEHDQPIGANFAVHRKVMDTVGPFDERLGPSYVRKRSMIVGEDALFSLRARQAYGVPPGGSRSCGTRCRLIKQGGSTSSGAASGRASPSSRSCTSLAPSGGSVARCCRLDTRASSAAGAGGSPERSCGWTRLTNPPRTRWRRVSPSRRVRESSGQP